MLDHFVIIQEDYGAAGDDSGGSDDDGDGDSGRGLHSSTFSAT